MSQGHPWSRQWRGDADRNVRFTWATKDKRVAITSVMKVLLQNAQEKVSERQPARRETSMPDRRHERPSLSPFVHRCPGGPNDCSAGYVLELLKARPNR